MVTPIVIIAAALAMAFLLPVLEKAGKGLIKTLSLLVLAGFFAASLSWIAQILQTGAIISQTAGFKAPVSINLSVSMMEATGLAVIYLVALLSGAFQIFVKKAVWQGKELSLYFALILGLSGLVMTRDLFNLFVFMEITSISLYGLLVSGRDERRFEGGFKYMIAGGLSSAFYLIGVAFLYRETGQLNLDVIVAQGGQANLYLPLLLLTIGILIELKPFPANGWALDVYESADPGTGAVISAMNTTALILVFMKLKPLLQAFGGGIVYAALIIAGLTFFLANLAGIRQSSGRRMLGYSSLAQTGLILFVLLSPSAGFSEERGLSIIASMLRLDTIEVIALALLINHALAKSALFWLTEFLKKDALHKSSKEGDYRGNRGWLIPAGMAVLALTALPPFPGFWAKWAVITSFGAAGNIGGIAVILIGSLLEVYYLFRWFIRTQAHGEDAGDVIAPQVPEDFAPEAAPAPASLTIKPAWQILAPVLSIIILTSLGLVWAFFSLSDGQERLLLPLAALALYALFDLIALPFAVKNILAMAGLGGYAYLIYGDLNNMTLIFGAVFIAGSLVQLFLLFNKRDKRPGLLPFLVMMILSLGNLLVFKSSLGFFFSWEMMTVSSFFLVIRGRQASRASLRYIMFSLAGAFMIMYALADGFRGPLTGLIFAIGLLIKMGAIGFHIWLPGAYAEAEDEVSTFLSSVLSKAGLFVLFITAGIYGQTFFPGAGNAFLASIDINAILGWIGVVTALAGAMMALFQEDIKYTLAYSSMGQIGYMILAFSIQSHLGWVTALYLAVTHLLFKGLLFMAIAGVIMRTGTRLMYQMGGLIKKMPISFISVLLAIIALSGVPPLTGFGGKWLLYSSLMEKGWYLHAGLAMFSSGVAFLYLFRLIHTIFLGQPKTGMFENIKEAPIWGLIPQAIFMMAIMGFSMFPSLLIKPLQAAVEMVYPAAAEGVAWQGSTVLSSLGYWNGSAVMYVTMGVFLIPLAWLMIVNSRIQKVKQFNIVFAAERPYKPETTHYAYNFFSHYQKALGFLVEVRAERFWTMIRKSTDAFGGLVRRIYSGNAQTYAFHIIIFVILFHLLAGGTF
ncbi:proton-conducting transporter membrane subunit [Spirochaeta isovalerica]|uniref:Formate hydrogenlyase subunit 3/multisubunit Na+/H+ antiporter MnhD subunit n=1 Tax=Spirochaeta isovalerica TaxID=150 RepID=A0A841RD23_9SPIO|nr:proton-conducting transporter membrane subunit [Spirochaeta isovalerica]MBB6480292.1 formate hydrogenlyase subunit 3/multisubunit Na+/H+ antiporter MnhD subunit [Spirochaeta isovalerica]